MRQTNGETIPLFSLVVQNGFIPHDICAGVVFFSMHYYPTDWAEARKGRVEMPPCSSRNCTGALITDDMELIRFRFSSIRGQLDSGMDGRVTSLDFINLDYGTPDNLKYGISAWSSSLTTYCLEVNVRKWPSSYSWNATLLTRMSHVSSSDPIKCNILTQRRMRGGFVNLFQLHSYGFIEPLKRRLVTKEPCPMRRFWTYLVHKPNKHGLYG